MTQPFDLLTEQDKETIKRYIGAYTDAEVYDLKPILKVWNKSKRTLCKGFGNQLRVKIPLEFERNKIQYQKDIDNIYKAPIIWDFADWEWALKYIDKDIKNPFIRESFKWIDQIIPDHTKAYFVAKQFSRLLSCSNMENGKTLRKYEFPPLNLTIPANTKIMKSIQRVIKAMNFPYMEEFEKFRNDISNLNANKSMKTNLVLSIHPIDFMTMSDNNCDWSSCMSWSHSGMYSTGTIEMMNSNVAAVAYFESKTPYEVCEMNIPNKSWRALTFIHKDIILVGKNYPYQYEPGVYQILEQVMKLVKDNLGWTYQFKHQSYRDLQWYSNNNFVRWGLSRYKMRYYNGKSRHKIICYTRVMYNDIIEDQDLDYQCCRNKVEKTKFISLSGRATCMCCGEYLWDSCDDNPRDIDCSQKICYKCAKNRCHCCDRVFQRTENNSEHALNLSDVTAKMKGNLYILPGPVRTTIEVCKDCIGEVRYYPALGIFDTRTVDRTFVPTDMISQEEDFLDAGFKLSYTLIYDLGLRHNLGYFWSDVYTVEDLQRAIANKDYTIEDLKNWNYWVPARERL